MQYDINTYIRLQNAIEVEYEDLSHELNQPESDSSELTISNNNIENSETTKDINDGEQPAEQQPEQPDQGNTGGSSEEDREQPN